jgi:hypothetical protein
LEEDLLDENIDDKKEKNIHSPESLASILEILSKLCQNNRQCQYTFFISDGIYILLNLISVYVMEIKKGGNRKLYFGSGHSPLSSPKKQSSSPPDVSPSSSDTSPSTPSISLYHPSFPYLFLIPSLALACLSSVCSSSVSARRHFIKLGGIAIALASLASSVLIRRRKGIGRSNSHDSASDEEVIVEAEVCDSCIMYFFVELYNVNVCTV